MQAKVLVQTISFIPDYYLFNAPEGKFSSEAEVSYAASIYGTSLEEAIEEAIDYAYYYLRPSWDIFDIIIYNEYWEILTIHHVD